MQKSPILNCHRSKLTFYFMSSSKNKTNFVQLAIIVFLLLLLFATVGFIYINKDSLNGNSDCTTEKVNTDANIDDTDQLQEELTTAREEMTNCETSETADETSTSNIDESIKKNNTEQEYKTIDAALYSFETPACESVYTRTNLGYETDCDPYAVFNIDAYAIQDEPLGAGCQIDDISMRMRVRGECEPVSAEEWYTAAKQQSIRDGDLDDSTFDVITNPYGVTFYIQSSYGTCKLLHVAKVDFHNEVDGKDYVATFTFKDNQDLMMHLIDTFQWK